MINKIYILIISLFFIQACGLSHDGSDSRVEELLAKMTIEEKIGQMAQINGFNGDVPNELKENIKAGRIGSILNEVNVKTVNEIQRIAIEESRLGIPLLIGRDVVHGFKTAFPIPLGLAATWNPEIVKKGSEVAAAEASSSGVNWTFAPMIDISRDSRWGRIAESFGEDPYLVSQMAIASTQGFQGDENTTFANGKIAACAKHFVGYGAAEGGRDYNTTLIPERELRDVYLPPFKAAVDAGIMTFMTGFNDLNGIPASGNQFLFKDILREEWQFDGMVVSDWASISEMIAHGFAADEKDAALKAINAGVDMEMASRCYFENLTDLVNNDAINENLLDNAVRNILQTKFKLGLFDNPYVPEEKQNIFGEEESLEAALLAAEQSVVLLKNENQLLPLSKEINSVAVIGPMSHEKYEQSGTWNFDGDSLYSVTPLEGIKEILGSRKVTYAKGLKYSRDKSKAGFNNAIKAAKNSDAIILCLGEEAIISGEAHCRAHIDLPGAQTELVNEIAKLNKPVIMVVMAGRALCIGDEISKSNAVLYAWHPGCMGGKAIANLIFGDVVPSGKLPITFPKSVGQIPMHYNHKPCGRPVNPSNWLSIDDIPVKTYQTSLGNTSHYLDDGFTPLFPFGYGLSYTTFEYSDLKIQTPILKANEEVKLSFTLKNTGDFEAEEVAQIYIRDLVGNVTRPVRELKAFERVKLAPNQEKQISITIPANELAFHNQAVEKVVESGLFKVWVGGDSNANLENSFEIK